MWLKLIPSFKLLPAFAQQRKPFKKKRQPMEWEKIFATEIKTKKMWLKLIPSFKLIPAFAQQRKPLKKKKRQPMEWEKIFANDATNRA